MLNRLPVAGPESASALRQHPPRADRSEGPGAPGAHVLHGARAERGAAEAGGAAAAHGGDAEAQPALLGPRGAEDHHHHQQGGAPYSFVYRSKWPRFYEDLLDSTRATRVEASSLEASDHGSVLREPMSATSAATRMPSRRPERPAVAAPKEPRSFGATQTAVGIRCGGFQHLDASLARPSESRRGVESRPYRLGSAAALKALERWRAAGF